MPAGVSFVGVGCGKSNDIRSGIGAGSRREKKMGFRNQLVSSLTKVGAASTYRATAGPAITMSANNSQSCWTLWHPASVTKTYKITRWVATWVGGTLPAQSFFSLNIKRITALGTGGTARGAVSLDPGDPTSGATFLEGPLTTANTRDADVAEVIAGANPDARFEWKATEPDSKQYFIRANIAEGWEMFFNMSTTAATVSHSVYFTVEWIEY
jgi:hypothetical protein